tara:strand:- start:494 stop:703 length:210 start_codon:yes stop_codon:yes gene_type:complete
MSEVMKDKLFRKGLTVKQFKRLLNKIPEDFEIYVSSDEELNTVYKGFYINHYDTKAICLAGLDGLEVED